MKLTIKAAFSFLVLLGILFACSKTEGDTSKKVSQAFDIIGKKYSIDAILKGDVTIRFISKTNEVLITYKEGTASEIKTAFAFTSQNTMSAEDEIIHLKNSSIYDFKDGGTVIVRTENNRIYAFSVDDELYSRRIEELTTSLKGTHLISHKGYELVRLRGKWEQAILTSDKPNVYSLLSTYNMLPKVKPSANAIGPNVVDPTCPQGQTYISCTSGGAGATSCSVEDVLGANCSVTCSGEYVACCNDPRTVCKCVVLVPNHNGGCTIL